MKKKISILTVAAIAFTSCGTSSYTTSSGQRFQDGIYAMPHTENIHESLASKEETDALIQKTRESEIYLTSETSGGHKTDTLFIPDNKSAVINFSNSGTSVTITDDPFDQVYLSLYPWTYYRPVTFRSAFWDPWYYGRYWGYYDPWYWDRWAFYDPWYWGVGLIFDPWFYDPWYWGPVHRPWYHHYCGWYGGWGPGFGWHGPGHIHGGHGRDIYYGHRSSTGLRNTVSSSRPRSGYSNSIRTEAGVRTPVNRRGVSTSSSTARRTASSTAASATRGGATLSASSNSSRRVAAGNRSGIVSTDRLTTKPATSTSGSQSYTPATGTRRSVQSYRGTASSGTKASSLTAGQSNWRKPASNSYNRRAASYGSSSSSYNRGTSMSTRSSAGSSFNRNGTSAFHNRSSSYNRQSSVNSSRSSVSRSSSFSGSRSSGYSGGSRSTGGGSSSVRRR